MSIDFNTDVAALYGTNVVTDAEYLAVDPARRDTVAEQNMLTMIELVRGYMASLRDDDEARMFHYAMGRMMAGVAYNTVYSDVIASVSGNTTDVAAAAANGDTVDITTASGTASIALASGPYADVTAVAADINALLAAEIPLLVTEVEAFNDSGKLGFRNTAGNEGVTFNLDASAPSLLAKAGINPGDVVGPVEAVANAARDDALAHYQRSGNPVAPV